MIGQNLDLTVLGSGLIEKERQRAYQRNKTTASRITDINSQEKSKKAKMNWGESPVDKLFALQAEGLGSVPRIYRHSVMHF